MEKDWIVIVRTQGKNNELELKNALDSLVNQAYKNFAVILTIHSKNEEIINNTLEFIENFGDKLLIHPVVVREKQGNRSFPLNLALKKAKSLNAKYLSFLDYDDIYYPNMGTDLIKLLKGNNYQFAYGLSIRTEQKIIKDKNGRKSILFIKREPFDTRNFNKVEFLLDNYIPFNSFILSAKYINDYNFDIRLSFLEDWDFLRRLVIREDFSVIRTDRKVSEYRITNDESDSHSLETESEWKKSRGISDSNIKEEITNIKVNELLEIRDIYQNKLERLIKIESNSFFKIARYLRNSLTKPFFRRK